MIKPTELRYIKKTNTLSITFEDGFSNDITSEYLRCFSPSAEVKGHGPGQEKLQINKATPLFGLSDFLILEHQLGLF